MGEEFPELTETQVCELLLEKWRGLDEMDEILRRYN
jgi:succinate dehydrogenase flavin-adding protein (antitoxin of CptAB toxin-antitoxin module)